MVYVHLKKDQAKLAQLSNDLRNYVEMGGTEAVVEPELNRMYLSPYSHICHIVECTLIKRRIKRRNLVQGLMIIYKLNQRPNKYNRIITHN